MLRDAFDASKAFAYAATIFNDRIADFTKRNPSLGRTRTVELAVLAHNWPAGADQIVRNNRLNKPDAIATWTTIPMADRPRYSGRSSYTQKEWSYVYPGRVLDGVSH
jgi:hypothetical protein